MNFKSGCFGGVQASEYARNYIAVIERGGMYFVTEPASLLSSGVTVVGPTVERQIEAAMVELTKQNPFRICSDLQDGPPVTEKPQHEARSDTRDAGGDDTRCGDGAGISAFLHFCISALHLLDF